MRGLIDNASSQEHQIALLWQAIEKLSDCVKTGDCVPDDAALQEHFEAGKLNDLVGVIALKRDSGVDPIGFRWKISENQSIQATCYPFR